jgi:glyoxylase-like metal-dependent hydrolase (beta-lactamase superfamily II)
MPLDTISHYSRPGADELVPSRYAIRVGEIEVLVISDGILPLSPATLATNAKPADLEAWLDDRLLPSGVFKWPLNAVVVRTGGRTMLIDAGIGAEYPDFKAGQFGARLEAAGIDPASVTDVVLTHMHFDHIGGLLADELGGRLSPGVPIHIAAAEVEFWKSPDFSRTSMPQSVQDGIRSAVSRFADRYGSQLRPFETECEVAPGVVMSRTGGHTPGHSVVHLASGGDRLTFVGDAVFPDHFDHPEWYNAFDHDPEEAIRVRVRLLRELAATGEPLMAAHLSFPSLGRVAVAGDAFRWVPAYWEY